jgi:hypothetical protein
VPALGLWPLSDEGIFNGERVPRDFVRSVNAQHQAWVYGFPLASVDEGQHEAALPAKSATSQGADGTADWIDEFVQTLPLTLGVPELMRILGRKERTIYRYIHAGLIETDRVYLSGSSPHIIPRWSVEKFLRRFPTRRARRSR